MSRLTAAQIIGLGEYLKPEFEPSTLTVSQLLGVLGYHNIPYPQPYTKPKLIQTFNEEIKANAKKLTKERLKKENSIASDDGITDGITGEPVGGRKVCQGILQWSYGNVMRIMVAARASTKEVVTPSVACASRAGRDGPSST